MAPGAGKGKVAQTFSSPEAAAAALAASKAAAASGSGAAAATQSYMEQQQQALNNIPPMAKLLGFAGALPFMALTPFVVESTGFDTLVNSAAMAQVTYGGLIVSFLGAVHWGCAMSSTMTGPKAAALARERYMWSVFPCLAAWPAMMMEPAPGSLCIALLLGIVYLSDRSYGRMGSLPSWYMALRAQLTSLSVLFMLCTTAYFLAKDYKKMQQRMADDDARKAAAAAAMLAPPPPLPPPLPLEPEAKKGKGKWW